MPDKPQRDDIRRYLLGALSEAKRDTVEDAVLTDEETYSLLISVEDELIDECAVGSLSEIERARFLQYVSLLPDRDRELRVASALAARGGTGDYGRPDVQDLAPWPYAVSARTLSVAAAVLVLLGAAWTLSVISRLSSDAQVQTSPIAREASEVEPVVVALTAGRLRGPGESQSWTLTTDSPVVEFRLDLPFDDYESYRAVLYDADSNELVMLNRLSVQSTDAELVVPFAMPTAMLKPGDYFIELSGNTVAGELESVARYDFRLSPP